MQIIVIIILIIVGFPLFIKLLAKLLYSRGKAGDIANVIWALISRVIPCIIGIGIAAIIVMAIIMALLGYM